MFTAVLRGRGLGFGLSLAGTAVCGSILLVAIVVPTGKGTSADDEHTRAETARQDDRDGVAGEKKPRGERPGNQDTIKRGEEDEKVAKLVRSLKSDQAADRIRAAEQLGKLKAEGKPAARALCEAAIDEDDSVRQAALEALEKVHPALYKPVSTLLVDSNAVNQISAAQTIGNMRAEGKAATPLLTAHLKRHIPPDGFATQNPSFFDAEAVITADAAALA